MASNLKYYFDTEDSSTLSRNGVVDRPVLSAQRIFLMPNAAARKGGIAPPGRPSAAEELPVHLPLTAFLAKALKLAHQEDAKPRPIRAYPVTSQMDYSSAELEFLMNVDAYKREQCKSFLTNTEMFAILTKRLGYRKVEGGAAE